MNPRWIIGLASGSSADGVDGCLLKVEGAGLHLNGSLVHWLHQPIGRELRELIQVTVSHETTDLRQISLLHRLLGEVFAAAARQVADRAGMRLPEVQCIGCAGHALWHETEGRFPTTLNVGMPAVIAERTGITTISDFRSRDLAAGGQGVPISALADHLLLGSLDENLVLVHMGGLARIVFLPAGSRIQDIFGFETGPCNRLLDGLIYHLTRGKESIDAGGKYAVQGRCIEALLHSWSSHPYFERKPPKTVLKQAFGLPFIERAAEQAKAAGAGFHDVLCTAAHLVTGAIADAFKRYIVPRRPHRIILSGGGTRNGLLLHLLSQKLGSIPIEKCELNGFPPESRKAAAIAVLAALTLDGAPANVPSATGASGSRLLGSLTPGATTNWASCLEWMSAQSAPASLAWN